MRVVSLLLVLAQGVEVLGQITKCVNWHHIPISIHNIFLGTLGG